jgi:hypothetical protein
VRKIHDDMKARWNQDQMLVREAVQVVAADEPLDAADQTALRQLLHRQRISGKRFEQLVRAQREIDARQRRIDQNAPLRDQLITERGDAEAALQAAIDSDVGVVAARKKLQEITDQLRPFQAEIHQQSRSKSTYPELFGDSETIETIFRRDSAALLYY